MMPEIEIYLIILLCQKFLTSYDKYWRIMLCTYLITHNGDTDRNRLYKLLGRNEQPSS